MTEGNGLVTPLVHRAAPTDKIARIGLPLPFKPETSFPFMRSTSLPLAVVTAFSLFASGCSEREVATYRVAKEKTATPTAAGSPPAAGAAASDQATMANTAVPTAQGADLTWTAPAHWQAKPASAMRKGSFAVPAGDTTADLSITAFPGDVGGEVANLNRWRGQLSLPAASEAEIAAGITRFEQGGLKIAVVDYDNGQQRLLGAIVPFRGSTWFVKLTGPAAPIAKEKPAFLDFLKTLKAPSTP